MGCWCPTRDGVPLIHKRLVSFEIPTLILAFRPAISPGEISEVEPVLGITKKALAQILEGEGAASITKLVLSPFAIPSSGIQPPCLEFDQILTRTKKALPCAA